MSITVSPLWTNPTRNDAGMFSVQKISVIQSMKIRNKVSGGENTDNGMMTKSYKMSTPPNKSQAKRCLLPGLLTIRCSTGFGGEGIDSTSTISCSPRMGSCPGSPIDCRSLLELTVGLLWLMLCFLRSSFLFHMSRSGKVGPCPAVVVATASLSMAGAQSSVSFPGGSASMPVRALLSSQTREVSRGGACSCDAVGSMAPGRWEACASGGRPQEASVPLVWAPAGAPRGSSWSWAAALRSAAVPTMGGRLLGTPGMSLETCWSAPLDCLSGEKLVSTLT
mmetsp:Transcript_116367/g.325485  ORF Transcript_116367/g.325485 Transcript_116367/m.325485 type:complete len:279 (+) Transcript_116367:150-986(+)